MTSERKKEEEKKDPAVCCGRNWGPYITCFTSDSISLPLSLSIGIYL